MSFSTCVCLCVYVCACGGAEVFSHFYLQHRGEGIGVFSHTTDVELSGEDRRVVVLIPHLDKHLGCVGCRVKEEGHSHILDMRHIVLSTFIDVPLQYIL